MRIDTRAVRGLSRLAFDATRQVTDLVEAMHLNISSAPLPWAPQIEGRTRGITGLVYRSIREISGGLGSGIDALLALPGVPDTAAPASAGYEAFRAALNGVVGDHLADSGNPLALNMSFRRDGLALPMQRAALAAALPDAGPRLLILVHGLCMNDLQWSRNGHDHGAALARDRGYTPVYLHYNSGRHISVNGREFADSLQALLDNWPVPVRELAILGHSMGGLVARSACHYGEQAGHGWLQKLRKLVFLGTPHHGAALERGGNGLQRLIGITPYTAPLARLGMLRSAGVTDLRHGNLLDDDWQDHDRFAHCGDVRRPLPLPSKTECYALAASTGKRRGDFNDSLIGDGLVSIASALGQHPREERDLRIPVHRSSLHYGLNHWDLLNHADVHARIHDWLA